jgi:hypothetical protein
MSGKTIHDYTDEELAALSTEDLAALRGDNHEGDEETEEQRIAREAEEKRVADEAAAASGGGDGGGSNEGLDADELARLAAEADGGDGGGKYVPHSRFQEVNAERKLLLEEVIRLRNADKAAAPAAAPAPPAYDFKAARKDYHKMLLEDPEAAAAKLEEIEDARDAVHKADLARIRQEARDEALQEFGKQRTQDHVDSTARSVYEKYPFLNHESKDADTTAIYAVIGRRDTLIGEGLDPVTAMAKAAEEVGSKFSVLLGKAAPPAAAPAPGPHARKVEETRRAADAAGRQPPTNQGGIGNRDTSGTLNVKDMTDEQLLELARKSPDELAKMRGDNRIPA